MDIPRKSRKRIRLIKGVMAGSLGIALVGAVTGYLSRLKPAVPVVPRAAVWTAKVQRGPMVRVVRGAGVLAPEEVRWVAAPIEGRVERILIQPGTTVRADTVLLVLSNPDLEKEVLDTQWQLRSAKAELTTREVWLKNELLNMQAQLAKLKAEHEQAKLQADVDEKLFQDGLLSERNHKLSQAKVANLEELIDIETDRDEMKKASGPAELAVQNAQLEQAKAMYELRSRQLASLQVRSGSEGVLQQWEQNVEVGRQVATGMPLAKVCNLQRLKAVLKVPEVQARDVQEGQTTEIDTGNAVISGRVVRIDPAAQEGTVAVEVALDGTLPREARPDLNVVGTVQIEQLQDVLHVSRPVGSQAQANARLFRIRGQRAEAVDVKYGNCSATAIQILEGLEAGDEVILSDMSAWNDALEVRLK
jgi:HlyD family secretion protein